MNPKYIVTVHDPYYPSSFLYETIGEARDKFIALTKSDRVTGHIIMSGILQLQTDNESYTHLSNEIEWHG